MRVKLISLFLLMIATYGCGKLMDSFSESSHAAQPVVYIAYYSWQGLMLANNISGNWSNESLDNNGDVGHYCSMAIDRYNRLYISYFDNPNGKLKFASNKSGAWISGFISDAVGSIYGMNTSIALDKQCNAHISYTNDLNNLRYAFIKNDGQIFVGMADSSASYSSSTSLAIDSKGFVHISGYNGTSYNIKYVTNQSGRFVAADDMDYTVNTGKYSAIAVDSQDKIHLSYFEENGGGYLRYNTNLFGNWQKMRIEEFYGNMGMYTSIAVDSKNRIHIAYYDPNAPGNLMYATNKNGVWNEWQVELLDSGAGEYTSIAIDGNDRVHISYYGNSTNSVKYITKVSGQWSSPREVGTASPGQTSIVVTYR